MPLADAPPEIDDATARRALSELFGETDVEVRRLFGEVDANFAVRGSDGARSILKFVHPDGPQDELEMQVAALEHLATRMPPGTVPAVMRFPSGEAIEHFEGFRIRRLSWIEGPARANSEPRSLRDAPHGLPPLDVEIGRFLGRLDRALDGFQHPAAPRPHEWNPLDAPGLEERLDAVHDPERRALLDRVLARWQSEVTPRRDRLPRAAIHADGHEMNLVVDRVDHPTRVVGVFDFGDMLETARVCEPAVAAAYAAMHTEDPLDGIAAVVSGYDAEIPLTDEELAVAVDLVRTRLAISVSFSAARSQERDDPYNTISEAGAWRVLEALDAVAPKRALARLRHACGREVVPGAEGTAAWLEANRTRMAPVFGDGRMDRRVGLDLSVETSLIRGDPERLDPRAISNVVLSTIFTGQGTVGVGRWNEARLLHLGPAAAAPDGDRTAEHRTVHLGAELVPLHGHPDVHLPLDGVVERVEVDGASGRVVIRHTPEDGVEFWSFWTGLDLAEAAVRVAGAELHAGARLGRVAERDEASDLPPHVGVRISLLGPDDDAAQAPSRLRGFATATHPNPAPFLGLPDDLVAAPVRPTSELAERRARTMGANLSVSYASPIEAVRGWRHHLWNAEGRAWLDLYNNVPHVGHAHPIVAQAISRQSSLFAANTRYLSRVRQDYIDRLLALLPESLDTAFLLPSASEANEVALRLARAATGRRELLVQDAAYHGHTTTLVDVSPYKANGPGGSGVADWVDILAIPDPYRGRHRSDARGPDLHTDATVGAAYAADVQELVRERTAQGRPPGAFLAETMPSVGGQIIPPFGYLEGVYDAVRDAGGIVIADEVQTGFGRLGSWMWGFEQQGVIPDVVVLGKPIANGFPMGVVVTRREIADAFANGMEFFSTFGGNPVACAAGAAVIEVLEAEDLQANAERSGRALIEGLRARSADHPCVGEVRGLGLFTGVVMVQDRESRAPAPEIAAYVVRRMMEEGVLAGTDGPDHDVVKLRGPLTVDAEAVEFALGVWSRILSEPGATAR